MNRIVSHVKSKQHFDAIWNNVLDTYSKYFSNNLPNSFAYTFKLTGFLNYIYSNRNIDSIESFPNVQNVISCQNQLLDHASSTTFTPSLNNLFVAYVDSLLVFEKRKKTISTDKICTFFLESYRSMNDDHKNTVVLPFTVDEILNQMLSDFYPSVVRAFTFFINSKQLAIYNNKYNVTFLKKHNITNDDLESINSPAKYVDLISNTEGILQSLSHLSTLVNSLIIDKEYIELKYAELEAKIEKQEKEGMNGYLLTWH